MLFDTHCHVNDGAYAEDRPAVFDLSLIHI